VEIRYVSGAISTTLVCIQFSFIDCAAERRP
jgi:hypothetical protein